MRESYLEKKCVQYAKKHDALLLKWVSPQTSGVPDRILIKNNRAPVFIEFKTLTGKLSPLQKVFKEALENLGQEVEVIRDFETFKKLFDDL